MTTELGPVRDLVYETLAAEGRAPSIAELATRTDTAPELVRQTLRELAEAHALVLTPEGDAIRMAHPFSTAPMGFVVSPQDGFDDRRWWGGCAWDSFGISAAMHLRVRIDTACPHCGTHLSYCAGPDQPPPAPFVVRFPRPAEQWWDDIVATCSLIRTFCRRGHAEQWTEINAPGRGYVTDVTTVWKLALSWYGDRLHPEFRPHSREHNQEILDQCSLDGPFWRLP